MFSNYAKWIYKFPDKIYPLNKVSKFPLNSQQIKVFESLKLKLANAAIQIDENIPLITETDVSDFGIFATLIQGRRPRSILARYKVANNTTPVKKEAQTVIKSFHHWRHFLLGGHFTLITD